MSYEQADGHCTTALFFLAISCTTFAQFPTYPLKELPGVLKGNLTLPGGLARPHPFILAYSAAYGEQDIPVEEDGLTARFAINLKPGIYYLFVALDGYEPTCHVADISGGEVVVYNPKLGPDILIKEYIRAVPTVVQLPLFGRPLPALELSPLPPK